MTTTTRTDASRVHPFLWLLAANGALWVLAHQVARIAFDGPPFLQGTARVVFWSYATMSFALLAVTLATGIRLVHLRYRKQVTR